MIAQGDKSMFSQGSFASLTSIKIIKYARKEAIPSEEKKN
jgi:hypothetical protein